MAEMMPERDADDDGEEEREEASSTVVGSALDEDSVTGRLTGWTCPGRR